MAKHSHDGYVTLRGNHPLKNAPVGKKVHISGTGTIEEHSMQPDYENMDAQPVEVGKKRKEPKKILHTRVKFSTIDEARMGNTPLGDVISGK